jgi:predicted AAA+ superfamily ATPase
LNESLDPSNCLLFLDEIQESPEIFAKLRWFYEDCPELCVIAAGSLLEFLLENHTFSMPVGRISYLHLEPLSFEEFLAAGDKTALLSYIQNYHFAQKIPEDIHQTLSALFKEYMMIGGMPAAVASWTEEKSLQTINQIHHDLISTYRDDFSKYSTRIDRHKIDEILHAIPKQLGQKFVYKKADSAMQASTVRNILSLLEQARLCHSVSHVSASGLPLAAQTKEKVFKEIFLDIGLSNAFLGTYFGSPEPFEKMVWSYDGGLAEQIVGQILRTTFPFYIQPALYYWSREDPGATAEIDYIIDDGQRIIPIEVKAGATGSLKSLHLFMNLKNLKLAVRIHTSTPSVTQLQDYTLLSIPFYLTSQIPRLWRNL